jgi:hypothetical protein
VQNRSMATRPRAAQVRQDRTFKGRQFTAEVILWARLAKGSVRRSRMEGQGEGVRWYLMFPLSYHDLELMLLDRSVEVDPIPSSDGSRPLPLNWRGGSGRICAWVLSALAPASIVGRMKVEIVQAACNTLRTVAVRRWKWNLR